MNTRKVFQIFPGIDLHDPGIRADNRKCERQPQHTDMDFGAIDAYVSVQMNNLGIPGMALRSLLVFHPELGYDAIAVATLGICWSVVFSVMYLRMRRAK